MSLRSLHARVTQLDNPDTLTRGREGSLPMNVLTLYSRTTPNEPKRGMFDPSAQGGPSGFDQPDQHEGRLLRMTRTELQNRCAGQPPVGGFDSRPPPLAERGR